jgi:hypothetical protein
MQTDGGKPIHLLTVKPEWIRSVTVGQRASFEIKAEINKLLSVISRVEITHLFAGSKSPAP